MPRWRAVVSPRGRSDREWSRGSRTPSWSSRRSYRRVAAPPRSPRDRRGSMAVRGRKGRAPCRPSRRRSRGRGRSATSAHRSRRRDRSGASHPRRSERARVSMWVGPPTRSRSWSQATARRLRSVRPWAWDSGWRPVSWRTLSHQGWASPSPQSRPPPQRPGSRSRSPGPGSRSPRRSWPQCPRGSPPRRSPARARGARGRWCHHAPRR